MQGRLKSTDVRNICRRRKEGIQIAFSIIPYLVGMLVAITIFRASGALDFVMELLKPVFAAIGVPTEVVPLALIRPISGTAALGMTSDLIATYGPDSFIGKLAAVMQGSTDTTLYILTVYFGAVGIKNGRCTESGAACRPDWDHCINYYRQFVI